DPPRGLERDVAPEPVVERAAREPSLAELHRLGGDHADVARTHEAPGLVGVPRPYVDVHVLDVGGLPLGRRRRLAAARHDSLDAGQELDPLADERLDREAADTPDRDVALVVDVRRDEADLVDVADERAARATCGSHDPGEARPDGVPPDLGECAGRLAPNGGGSFLEAGRPGRT